MSDRKIDLLVLLLIFITVYITSIIFLTNPSWDFFNYQAYNCYNFINDRYMQDIFASNSRISFNPYVYLPEYLLMFKLNNHPYIFIMISIVDTVIALFLAYKILKLTFKVNNKINPLLTKFNIFLCIVYVAFTPVMIDTMDFSRSDTKIAALELLSIYIILKNLFSKNSKIRILNIFTAGFILGIALTLKYSCINCIISLLLIFILLYKKIDNPFKTIFLFCISISISFMITNGYWLYKMYNIFHNPVFPYFNDIFKSEYINTINILSYDYIHLAPVNWKEFLFYPFYRYNETHYYAIEYGVFDPRYAINFILVICIGIYSFYVYIKKSKNILFSDINKNIFIFIILFTIIQYYTNLSIGLFENRYIESSSLLYGIILFTILLGILNKAKNINIKKYILSLSMLIIIAYAYYGSVYGGWPQCNYINFKDDHLNLHKISRIFEYKDLKIDNNSIVIMLNTPISLLAVNQNPNAVYVGIPLEIAYKVAGLSDYSYSIFLENKLNKFLNDSKKIYIMQVINKDESIEDINKIMEKLSEKYDRKLYNCENIDIKIFNSDSTFFNFSKCEFEKNN